jgi:hypothetical protein
MTMRTMAMSDALRRLSEWINSDSFDFCGHSGHSGHSVEKSDFSRDHDDPAGGHAGHSPDPVVTTVTNPEDALVTAKALKSLDVTGVTVVTAENDENGSENATSAATSPLAAAFGALERRCPDHIAAADWQHAVEDGRRFLMEWIEQATALGWTEPDVFGLPPLPANPHPMWRRLARVEQLGLVWLTHGRPVTSITAESATIATPSGGSLAFYRLPARQEAQKTTEQAAGDESGAGGTIVDLPASAGGSRDEHGNLPSLDPQERPGIEASAGPSNEVVNIIPPPTSGAAKPSYEVIGSAQIGQRCALCNSSIGARLRIRYGGQEYTVHLHHAAEYVKALAHPPLAGQPNAAQPRQAP